MEIADGECVVVKMTDKGTVSLQSNLTPDRNGLGSFEVIGLDPEKAAAKKKSFWRNLWNKVKGAAGAVLDAVTVPVFGYRCRPDIKVDITGRGVSFGISCAEA